MITQIKTSPKIKGRKYKGRCVVQGFRQIEGKEEKERVKVNRKIFQANHLAIYTLFFRPLSKLIMVKWSLSIN